MSDRHNYRPLSRVTEIEYDYHGRIYRADIEVRFYRGALTAEFDSLVEVNEVFSKYGELNETPLFVDVIPGHLLDEKLQELMKNAAIAFLRNQVIADEACDGGI